MTKVKYPKHSVGHLLTTAPMVETTVQVKDILAFLKKQATTFASLNYIYITDDAQVLRGVLSVKELLQAEPDEGIKKYIDPEIISVYPDTPQHEAGLLAIQQNIKALPVIDHAGKLIGMITEDQIMRIIDNAATKKAMKSSGIYHDVHIDDLFTMPIHTAVIHRLPWLVIGLSGGLLAAGIVTKFEDTISENLILATYIPLIVYMADAVGTQMEAFMIRDVSMHPKLHFFKYFFRQLTVVTIIGLIVSGLLFFVNQYLYSDATISIVLSIALMFAIVSAVCTGLLIPYIMSRFKFDPANASGPISTILQDILSIIVYFSVAQWLL